MHESERNRQRKRKRVLLIARFDMHQAAAAAEALRDEAYNVALMRALETALAVSYARPFTKSSLVGLDESQYMPEDAQLAELHALLLDLRDKVYAHTDKDSGRGAEIMLETGADGALEISGLRDEWIPFPRVAIPSACALFELQAERFLNEALDIQCRLAKSE
jgi:hypothetical protein